jgi:hypothetical protein
MKLTRTAMVGTGLILAVTGTALGQNQAAGGGAAGTAAPTGTQPGQQPLTNQQGVFPQRGLEQGTAQQTVPRGMSQLEAQAAQRRLQQQGRQPVGEQGPGRPAIGTGTAGRQSLGGARSQGGPELRTVPEARRFSPPESGPGAGLGVQPGRFDVLAPDFDQLTPEEVQQLQLGQFGSGTTTGSGRVHMSQDRFDRLMRQQQLQQQDLSPEELMQLQREGRLLGGDFRDSRAELARDMRRLAALEDRMLRTNDMLLQQLGQARQLPPERQIAATAEVIQRMLLEHEQMIGYMAQLRMAVQNQSEFAAYPGELSSHPGLGDGLRDRNLGAAAQRTGPRLGTVQPQRFQWEIEADARTGQPTGQRLLGSDGTDDTWQDWQDFRREDWRR